MTTGMKIVAGRERLRRRKIVAAKIGGGDRGTPSQIGGIKHRSLVRGGKTVADRQIGGMRHQHRRTQVEGEMKHAGCFHAHIGGSHRWQVAASQVSPSELRRPEVGDGRSQVEGEMNEKKP